MMLARVLGAAAQPGAQSQTGQAELAPQDLEFAREAAIGGLKEVTLGELALQQAKNEQIMQFAQRMVQDHGQANEKLMAIASRRVSSCRKSCPKTPSRNTRSCSSFRTPSSTRPTWTRW